MSETQNPHPQAPATRRISVLQTSAIRRCGLAAAVAALLWLVVAWALEVL